MKLILFLSHIMFVISSMNDSVLNESNKQLVMNYLLQYGYIEKSIASINSESDINAVPSEIFLFALKRFQELFNLDINGEITLEMLTKMNRARCGNEDIHSEFTLHPIKWGNKNITWNFHNGNAEIIHLTKITFNTWAQYTDLNFIHYYSNPNILISFRTDKHIYARNNNRCPFDLVQPAIAHAFFPNKGMTTLEIHIKVPYEWYTGMGVTPENLYSLFYILVHEIGHSLGIHHSFVEGSVMLPTYEVAKNFNNSEFKLSMDDILAIQHLYGERKTVITPTIITTTTTISPIISTAGIKPNLCAKIKSVNKFLLVNQRLYVLYKKYVWIVDISSNNVYKDPLLLTDWLTWLPKYFTNIDAIYQRPNKEIVIFIRQYIYIMEFPSFKLISGYPRYNTLLCQKEPLKINGAVNTYTGQTYIFYNNEYVMEVDECTLKAKRHKIINDVFPGAPTKFQSVFRYNNGLIYFFTNTHMYEYNEFLNHLIRAESKDLSIFGLVCPQESILQQLKSLLNRLIVTQSSNIMELEQDIDYDVNEE